MDNKQKIDEIVRIVTNSYEEVNKLYASLEEDETDDEGFSFLVDSLYQKIFQANSVAIGITNVKKIS